MFVIGYILRRHVRAPVRLWMIVIALTAVFMTECVVSQARDTYRSRREEAVSAMTVTARFSDLLGAKWDDLYIPENSVWLFTDEDGPLHGYFTDIHLKRSVQILEIQEIPISQLDPDKKYLLIGINKIAAAEQLLPENDANIHFFPGYGEEDLQSGENYCLINIRLNEILPIDEQAGLTLSVMSEMQTKHNETVRETFTVIGTVDSKHINQIYAPFDTVTRLGQQSDGLPMYAERMSVTVSDNRLLDAAKSKAAEYFPNTGQSAHSVRNNIAITFFDEQYNSIMKSVDGSLRSLLILSPFLLVLCIGVGILTAVLLTRSRRVEYSILSGLGAKKLTVICIFLGEYIIPALISFCCAAAAFALVYGALPNPGALAGGVLFFYLGAIPSTLYLLTAPAFKFIKRNE